MTEEERQNLCDKLRDRTIRIIPKRMCETAADELERLAKNAITSRDLIGTLTYENKRAADEIERLAALAQSDAEPRDIREALADIRALEVRLIEQKQLNELLAEELKQARRAAQSNAEPCKICGGSGQIRYLGRDNSEEVEDCSCRLTQSDTEPDMVFRKMTGDYIEASRLKPAPPRPDASAGLIEAAEIAREWAGATSSSVEAHLLDALARELRARAADRSGK